MSSNADFFKKRRAGILLHPTSLPGTPGNGDLGEQAYRFVDFLADCGISIWQMLPLGPPHEDLSPYQCQSVHAANPLLISLDRLVEKGWLSKDSVPTAEHELEHELKRLAKQGWLTEDVLARELKQRLEQSQFRDDGFCPQPEHDAAMRYRHARLKEARAGFEKNASATDSAAFDEFTKIHAEWLDDYGLFRALSAEHHQALKADCLKALNEIHHHDALKGSLLELTKAAGWWGWRPELRDRQPQALEAARLRLAKEIKQHRFEQFVFFSQWEALKAYANQHGVLMFGDIPIFVAEDLGVITHEVNHLRERFGLPGMKILQFAFDSGNDNPYLPHNHIEDCLVYTGTHDNDTTLGWYHELPEHIRQFARDYLRSPLDDMPWPLVEAAFASKAQWAIVPMQDVLALDGHHRMNVPGVPTGNWRWRFDWSQKPHGVHDKLRDFCQHYNRT
ncbi:MAG TPA: 4-alpha-glucanotransferase [Thioploca sp.]|nr:4-alpha-glucanotransferase [Thioploca sp.]